MSSTLTLPPSTAQERVLERPEPAPALRRRPSTFGRPAAPQRRWRYEFKYIVARHLRRPLTRDLCVFSGPDRHASPYGFYTVKSLYLDSPDWMCFHEKLAGLPQRHKLRVRCYPDADDTAPIKFEVKYRSGQRISKDVALIDDAEYRRILPALHARRLVGGHRLNASRQIQAFFRLKQIHAMAPVVSVQFRRQALSARADRHVRITLDDSLVACRARDLFEPMPPSRSLLERQGCILEVKIEHDLPFWLQRLIEKYGLRPQPVSKYGLAVANGPFGLDNVQ